MASERSVGPSACPICHSGVEFVYRGHPGYVRGLTYDIWHCRGCDTSFAWPLQADPEVYELIYGHADRVPGYEVYARLAETVRRHADPLSLLARRHPTYWAIREHLLGKHASGSLSVLDYGCGLGYLTHALNRAGVACQGVDVSGYAIAQARSRYGGDAFHTVAALANVMPARGFDVVTCLELIEHVPDPTGLLADVRRLVADGGEVLLSSPNKAAYPPDALWATDAPPVHLWWFSPASVAALARAAGFSACRFVDLRAFPHGDVGASLLRDYSRPIAGPTLAEDRSPIAPAWRRLANRAADLALRTGMVRVLRDLTGRSAGGGPDRGPAPARYLFAILSK